MGGPVDNDIWEDDRSDVHNEVALLVTLLLDSQVRWLT